MTHYEYQKTLMIGVIIGVAFTLLGFYMLRPSPQNHTVTPKTNFAVVDKYEDRCDIVQWSDNQMSTYKYFLFCKDK